MSRTNWILAAILFWPSARPAEAIVIPAPVNPDDRGNQVTININIGSGYGDYNSSHVPVRDVEPGRIYPGRDRDRIETNTRRLATYRNEEEPDGVSRPIQPDVEAVELFSDEPPEMEFLPPRAPKLVYPPPTAPRVDPTRPRPRPIVSQPREEVAEPLPIRSRATQPANPPQHRSGCCCSCPCGCRDGGPCDCES